jgi:hypothetical protein
MASKKAKAIAVVVSIIAIAGVVGYVLYRRKKAKQTSSTFETDFVPSAAPSTPSRPQPSAPIRYTFPFKTEAEGNKFRAWVNDNYPDFARSIELDRTGKLNSYVQRAWDKYGFEYLNTTYQPKPPQPVNVMPPYLRK